MKPSRPDSRCRALTLVVTALLVAAAAPAAWPPAGEAVRVPITRDTWVSAYEHEALTNLGAAPRLKTKSWQEFALVDFDPRPLAGRTIVGATLHLKCVSPDPQRRLTVSTLAAEWVEGTGSGYQKVRGATSFNMAEQDVRPWAWPGSDVTAVALSGGHTRWAFADPTPPDRQGWQVVAVEPSVVAARLAGLSYGLVVFDDDGSEWEYKAEKFTYRIFPNRFVASREAGAASAPYLTLYLGPADTQPPAAVTGLRSDATDLPPGEARVTWTTSADAGPAGTLGFLVRYQAKTTDFGWDKAADVPRYLIPLAGKPGAEVTMHLRDLGVPAGGPVALGVRPVDAVGNVGPVATITFTVAPEHPLPTLKSLPPFTEAAPLPEVGGVKVFVMDLLDKIHPVSGALTPEHPENYRAANHLWSAKDRRVRLAAARNEFTAFHLACQGQVTAMAAKLTFDRPEVTATFGRLRHVTTERGPLPDPVLPLTGPLAIPAKDDPVPNQQYAQVLVEVFVPRQTPPGPVRGRLELTANDKVLALDVDLQVWNFTLPDYLSFLPEMNCYGLPDPPLEVEYYRLAHRHRTVLNCLTYGWSGRVHAGVAPVRRGEEWDWTAWDQRWSPLLDGSAFRDLPRAGVPVDAFYLALNDNWPMSITDGYRGGFWPEEAFTPAYRAALVAAARSFGEHCAARGWRDTLFEFYLNGKVYYKEKAGWKGCCSLWVLDEPSSTQDFWALRWYAQAFHEGVTPVRGQAKMAFRGDISRSQWQRDILDGLLDVDVIGGPFRQYHRLVAERKQKNGEVVFNYGATNAVAASNVQAAAWCLETWCQGGDGVLPWQTIGNDASWQKDDALSLFYPGGPAQQPGPVPSIRLKAYCRGQQDVEYLVLLQKTLKCPAWVVAQAARQVVSLEGRFSATSSADAGRVDFAKVTPEALWALRTAVGQALNQAAPPPAARLRDLRPPVRDLAALPPLGYVTVAPPQPGLQAADPAVPAKPTFPITVQGKPQVRDAMIDWREPTRNYGGIPRDNRMTRENECNALLLRCDLPVVPPEAQVVKAELYFYVWDPHGSARSRVAAYPLTVAWDEAAVTWQQPAAGKTWTHGTFTVGADTAAAAVGEVIVNPNTEQDTVNPPEAYAVDITKAVQDWLAGRAPNCGIALMPLVDRQVDDGHWTRFQVLSSEYQDRQFTPKLVLTCTK